MERSQSESLSILKGRSSQRNRAAILLATYNGERFLAEMLDSLARQTHRAFDLLWRDDGSTDRTPHILRALDAPFPVVEVSAAGRMGPAQNFLWLLRAAAGRYGSYHFADQDDVWLPEKIERSHQIVVAGELPLMIHGSQELIDESSSVVGVSRPPGPSAFENAMVENIAVGCTVAFNDAAAALAAMGTPTGVRMHDWWLYLTVSCFGDVIYDATPRVQYRQHALNAVGSAPAGIRGLATRLHRRLNHPPDYIVGQLRDFLFIHDNRLSKSRRSLIAAMLEAKTNPWARLQLACRPRVWRQSALDNAALRVLLALNRL
jgi:glycosyltransferase involved in cell wall biosynthesis